MTTPGITALVASGPLPGMIQTVPLAELHHLSVSLRHAEPRLDISTECYSIIALIWLGKNACFNHTRQGFHSWTRIWFHLDDLGSWAVWEQGSRPDNGCAIRCVPAHMPKLAVDAERTTLIDYAGNKAA